MKRTMTTLTTIAILGAGGALGGLGLMNERGSSATASRVATESVAAYTVDPVHTNVIFKIRHAGVSNFYGRFNEISGNIEFDGEDFTSAEMSFEIPVKSVDTNSSTRDGHLRNAEFFNERQFPTISFESTGVKEVSEGVYELKGKLTLMGETKVIRATVTDVRTGTFRDNPVMGFEARFTIERAEYGITKYVADDRSDDGPLGNTVEIVVAVEAGQG